MTPTAQDEPLVGAGEHGTQGGDSASLVPFLQPFYNLATGRLQGVEALARYRTEDGGTRPPSADQGPGAAQQMDLQVLDMSLSALGRLQGEAGYRDLILSVNLSEELLTDPESVTEVVASLRRHGIPGHRLLVDITSDMFRRLDTDNGASGSLRGFQQQEITFCLDNFTAEDLDLLPEVAQKRVDIIKVSPRLLAGGDSEALTRIADAVQEAGVPMVAAGVETSEQLSLARELGMEWVQGFFLGAPAPAEEFSAPAELTV